MKIIETFKTPIAKFVLNEDLKALVKFSRKCAKDDSSFCIRDKRESHKISLQGGYQSPDLNLNIPELQSLRKQTTRCFNEFKTKFFYKAPIVIGNMWLNINYPKGYQPSHNHPRCCFASSFYLSVPKNSGNIIFYNDSDLESYMPQKWITKFGAFNSSKWTLPVENNTFYVFPGWLKHSVEENNSQEDRISISINATDGSLT